MKKSLLFLLALTAFSAFAPNLPAQNKVRVKFARGTTSAALKGTVIGYKYIDYIARARSGQKMSVKLKTTNPACTFSVYYSDMKDIGEAADVAESVRNVDVDDNYVVRVMLPRSAARRKESASFTLSIRIE